MTAPPLDESDELSSPTPELSAPEVALASDVLTSAADDPPLAPDDPVDAVPVGSVSPVLLAPALLPSVAPPGWF